MDTFYQTIKQLDKAMRRALPILLVAVFIALSASVTQAGLANVPALKNNVNAVTPPPDEVLPPLSNGDRSACFGSLIPELSVTATGTANWYSDAALSNLVYTGLSYATGMTAVGAYSYYVTNTIGTESSLPTMLTLTILPLPSAPVSGGDLEVCYGAPVPDLTVLGSGILTWYGDENLSNVVNVGNTFTSGQTKSGLYTYYATSTDENGCESESTAISLSIADSLEQPISLGDQAVCYGNTAPSLEVVASQTIQWYSNPTFNTLVFTGAVYNTGITAVGVYPFYVVNTNALGCKSLTTIVTLTIHPLPAQVVSGGDQSVTFGDPVSALTASADSTIYWYSDAGLTNLVYTGSSFATGYTAIGHYPFYLVTNNSFGCTSIPTVITLDILSPSPAPVSLGDKISCFGEPNPALSVTAGGTAKWYTDSQLTNLVNIGLNYTPASTAVGDYTYYVVNVNVDDFVSLPVTVKLSIKSLPVPVITGNADVCFGIAYSFATEPGMTEYNWMVSIDGGIVDGGDELSNTVSVIWWGLSGEISLNYTDEYGCTAVSPTVFSLTTHTLPVASVSGSSLRCLDAEATYTTEPGMSSYSWIVPAAASVVDGGGTYDGFVTLAWNNIGNHVVGITYTNVYGCTTENPALMTVNVVTDSPLVDAGAESTIYSGNQVQLNGTASGAYPPYQFSWSPAATLSDPTVANPMATPMETQVYTLIVTDEIGCKGTDMTTVNVIPANPMISGKVFYDNAMHTPLPGIKVYLKSLAGARLDSTITDAAGNYAFTGMLPGAYRLSAVPVMAWGGVNGTDALLVLKHFTQISVLQGLAAIAADVTGNGFVNSLDALIITNRFTGQISSFGAPDFIFSNTPVTVSNQPVYFDIRTLCAGDVNRSYIPNVAKTQPSIALTELGSMSIKSGESFDLPVKLLGSQTLGAISLVIYYNAAFLKVSDVAMNSAEPVYYTNTDGELRIVWYSLSPLNLVNDDLLTVRFLAENLRSASASDLAIQIGNNSEIADENGAVLENVNLSYPKLLAASNELSLSNYPNPFTGITRFGYSLTDDADVSMKIYNAMGELQTVLLDKVQQQASDYTVEFDGSRLAPGVYFCRFEVAGASNTAVITRPIIIQ